MRQPSTRCARVLRTIIATSALALVSACAVPTRPAQLPPPVATSALSPGDVFAAQIVGEPDLPTEFTVAPDGTADIPYIGRIHVDGLEPQEVTRVIVARLVAEQILFAPSVTVRVLDYKSKRVTVGGEVKTSGAFPFEPGMTLQSAIARAGGVTSLARGSDVIVIRRGAQGSKSAVVNFDAIAMNHDPDVVLAPGDTITVPRRVF